MPFFPTSALALLAIASRGIVQAMPSLDLRNDDACAKIANQTWSTPKDVRDCYRSFPVNETIKANVSAHTSYHP